MIGNSEINQFPFASLPVPVTLFHKRIEAIEAGWPVEICLPDTGASVRSRSSTKHWIARLSVGLLIKSRGWLLSFQLNSLLKSHG